ncbi:nickel transporter [Peterkaempfera sp. SMS 1(5)a]|uniref:nickel transporter n=1 Tax=Peterkaempfera podocarpi TaxID=3232308 RepID=UPI0036724A2E
MTTTTAPAAGGRTARRRRILAPCAAVLFAAGALVLLPAGAANAHPLGNFTVNRYDGLVASPGHLRIDHDEDLAEIPATQAEPRIRQLGMTAWAQQRCEAAARGSTLTVAGRRVGTTVVASRAELLPGQAGLHTLRVECRLTAPLPAQNTVSVAFHSAGADSGPGWREITARGDRMTLTTSDVPLTSVSHTLTSYPKSLLSSPADTSTAALRIRPGGAALVDDEPAAAAPSVLPRGADRWTQALDDLITRRGLTPGFAAFALAAALALGALHALAPGHGKTLMAATAAARGRGRATIRDVLPLAASVTVTHTLGVVALGLLIAAGSTATTSVIAWLGIASGVLVTATGAGLVRRAVRGRGHTHHTHGHPHTHRHPHTHDHPHLHTDDHPHLHTDGDASHTPTHDGHTHPHNPAPTLRGTLLLGFAGGLVPSPSAVVVLVGATALGQAWFGVLLVLAYGAGLALTLTVAGFTVVRAGDRIARAAIRRRRSSGGRPLALLTRAAPLGSALAVVAVGAGLILREASAVLG